MSDPRLTRRGSLVRLGGFAAALFGAGGWRLEEDANGAGPAAVASGAVRCVLTPEQTEGPYYIAGEKVRRTITDGRPGTPLTLHLQVVNARPASRSRAPRSTSGTPTPAASTRGSGRARATARSCGGSRRRTRRESPPSARSIPGGTWAGRSTST